MKKILALAFVAALSACQGEQPAPNICDRAESVFTGYADKCPTSQFAASLKAFDKAASCDANKATCTAADKDNLNLAFDCIEALPSCAAADVATNDKLYVACLSKSGNNSDCISE